MAVAEYKFLYICGRIRVGGRFVGIFYKRIWPEYCSKFVSIVQNSLPEDARIGSINMPFVFVADDAFPLVDRILKPYTPPRGRCLTDSEKNLTDSTIV